MEERYCWPGLTSGHYVGGDVMVLSGLAMIVIGVWLAAQAIGGNLAGRVRSWASSATTGAADGGDSSSSSSSSSGPSEPSGASGVGGGGARAK